MTPTIVTKIMHCTYRRNNECNFGNSSCCKDKQWGNPEECVIYNLIEKVNILEAKS